MESVINAHSTQQEIKPDTIASCLTASKMKFSQNKVDAEDVQNTQDQLTTVSIAEQITAVMMKNFK